MPLSMRFVKEIHSRLAIRYGTPWASKWVGLDMALIEADWADQLDGMQPDNIRRALASLPAEFPPTATAFRALGINPHPPMADTLPALPPPDPEGLRRVGQAIKEVMRPEATLTERAAECLANLRGLRKAGTINAGQRDFLQRMEAGLGLMQSNEPLGDFHEIADNLLPPGMRDSS